jgi:hypothetical protein
MVVILRILLHTNVLDDLIQADLDFNSCTIPVVITFHVVWVLNFLCAEKVASLVPVFPYSRSTAFTYLATFFSHQGACHSLLYANPTLILGNDKSNYIPISVHAIFFPLMHTSMILFILSHIFVVTVLKRFFGANDFRNFLDIEKSFFLW